MLKSKIHFVQDDLFEIYLIVTLLHRSKLKRSSSSISFVYFCTFRRYAFEAPLPPSWDEHLDPDGRVYYSNEVGAGPALLPRGLARANSTGLVLGCIETKFCK